MLPSQAAVRLSTTEDDKIVAISKKAKIDESEVRDRIDEQVEEMKEHQSSAISDDDLRGHAISIVKNELFNMTGGGGGGFVDNDAEELSIMALGFQEKDPQYFVTDNEALLASAIVNPPNDPAGFAMVLIDSGDGVDLEHASDAFQYLNTVRGFAAKRQVGSWDDEPTIKKGGNPTYVVETKNNSTFEVVDPNEVDDDDPLSELPADREAKRQMIHDYFITDEETVTLQTYAEHETIKNSRGYPVAFGSDVKRVRGEVVDSYIFDSGDGVMTITDDTIFAEEDVSEELIGDKQRTPGLQVSVGGDFVFGEKSILDIYGYIEQRDDGQYKMQAFGVIPIVEFDYDGPQGSGSSGADDDAVDEDTI